MIMCWQINLFNQYYSQTYWTVKYALGNNHYGTAFLMSLIESIYWDFLLQREKCENFISAGHLSGIRSRSSNSSCTDCYRHAHTHKHKRINTHAPTLVIVMNKITEMWKWTLAYRWSSAENAKHKHDSRKQNKRAAPSGFWQARHGVCT